MDCKNTLNLPKTDFAMKADLVTREPLRLEKWERENIYRRIQESRAQATRFVLHDGPPFANGDVHIGTALNKILKDIIVKFQTQAGRQAPYIPGWDCHGLPIEFKVSQEMRKAGDTNTDPATIRNACDAYARKFIDLQRIQFKRLGVFGDWSNPYLTLDREYEANELQLFADIVEKGFVYRGKKPVYWSIPCRTALAEAEVEYADHVSQSIYVKFPVIGRPNTFILIWTTTPWTLPANLAIAYNSTFSYSAVRHENSVYVVSTMLLPTVAEKCGWEGYEIMRSLDGEQLSQVEFSHPFCERTGRLFAGDHFVENSTGTGFVHIAPGHGLEDYGVGQQNGLPIYSPVDDDGRLAHTNDLPMEQQMPTVLVGKSILEKGGMSEANTAVLELLKEKNAMAHREEYHHSYPHCWRSKTPVIFRAMDQWFIRIDHQGFREQALETIQKVRWIPDWGQNRIEGAVKSRPDWCISRQRSWGVPIPAFYLPDGEPLLHPEIVRSAAALIAQHGSNVWFEKTTAEIWNLVKPFNWTGPDPVSKSADTLDVWIDSGSSSRAVLMQREELKSTGGQADVYLEGSDQHRGWFQSSLLLSLAGNGRAPFKTVLTHGFMVDADREKISKSKQGQGGYEKPQTADAYVKKYGADVVRLWVASQDYRNDIVVSEERINKVSETYRAIRNTLRYQLSNLYDFDPAKNLVPTEQMDGLDRWILSEFSRLEEEIWQAYEAFEFHLVYQKVSQFVAVQLSSIYHDIVKDRLYTDPAGSPRRRSTQTALFQMVKGLAQLLSPILAYTADETWDFIPGEKTYSVHLAAWNKIGFKMEEVEAGIWSELFSTREELLPKLEEARQAKIIGKSLEAKIVLHGAKVYSPEILDSLRELLNVSQLLNQPGGGKATVEKADGKKCDRCWHWEFSVGNHPEHPGLCDRCVEAVKQVS